MLGNPDADQVAADVVSFGEPVEGLAGQIVLDDLPLELDRIAAVLGHGLSPRKPGRNSLIRVTSPVHPVGCTPEADQVAPALTLPTLRSSENEGNQGCSQRSRTSDVSSKVVGDRSENGFDARRVASDISSSEHRRISDDNGGGTLRKASPCSNCGVSDADVQTKHASFPDLPPFLNRRPDRSAPSPSSPDEPGEEGEVYENE